MTDIFRVALYARVSTIHNQDPEMQLRELREYAARRGWKIVGEYVDHDDRLQGIAARAQPHDGRCPAAGSLTPCSFGRWIALPDH